MPANKIMLIRHAEKPDANGNLGVSLTGHEDPRELSVRGWQRAGALVSLFGPSRVRSSVPVIATPTVIFASCPTSSSIRPLHTVETLAQRLAVGVDASHRNGDEACLAANAFIAGTVVLVSWKHDGLPTLANAILGSTGMSPQRWPADRFDMVWVFDRIEDSGGWTFGQVPQLLLPGDRAETIPR